VELELLGKVIMAVQAVYQLMDNMLLAEEAELLLLAKLVI
jgi:hypothetical protein